ncbi:Uncharacterised protein [Salmonella enterica subsp. enterica serovar Typhimurium str. DT104]|nr:Uncharacterised protein [Salmonella enterica subsp. enterica serovar Typhimurium str. DT104]
MDLKKYKKFFLIGFILTNLAAATAVSLGLILNIYNNYKNNLKNETQFKIKDDNNKFFSISDSEKITDLNKLL